MNLRSTCLLMLGSLAAGALQAQPPAPRMDSDGNGVVTWAEFQAAAEQAAQDRFTRLDANSDGQLSGDELKQAQGPWMHRGSRAGRPKIDTNGDGAWSLAELQAVWPGFDEQRFERMDRNGDGLISADERPMRGHHHGFAPPASGDSSGQG